MKTKDRMTGKKSGAALAMVIIAGIFAAGFVATISTLNRGLNKQTIYANQYERSYQMAYSVFSTVMARIHTDSWAERPFGKPPKVLAEYRKPLFDGTYDLHVEDTEGREFEADIYIRTHLLDMTRMYFWRIRYNPDILEITPRFSIVIFTSDDQSNFPDVNGDRPVVRSVNKILADRASNQRNSDITANEIVGLSTLDDIQKVLGARPSARFKDNYPKTASDTGLFDRLPVPPPQLEPITAREQPNKSPQTTARKGAGVPTGGGPPPTANDGWDPALPPEPTMEDLQAKLEQESKEAKENLTQGGNLKNQEQGPATHDRQAQPQNPAEGTTPSTPEEYIDKGKQAEQDAFDTMDDLLELAEEEIAQAPTEEAKKALENQAADAIAEAIYNIVQGYSSYNAANIDLNTADKAAITAAIEEATNKLNEANQLLEQVDAKLAEISDYDGTIKTKLQKLISECRIKSDITTLTSYIEEANAALAALEAQENAETPQDLTGEASAEMGSPLIIE